MGRRYIVNRLRTLGEHLGRRPTLEEFVATRDASRKDIKMFFEGGYSEALNLAGLTKSRKQVEKERKKRGYIPPWNYLGGETLMDPETARKWRLFSKILIEEIGFCEEESIFHDCNETLAVHHIIPRRCGGVVLERRNCVVLCNAAHKLQPADLYWRTADDIDFRILPEYQLERLTEGTHGLASDETGLETDASVSFLDVLEMP